MNNLKIVVLVEQDYKGSYERFALTLEQFAAEYEWHLECDHMPSPSIDGESWTLNPLVHVWYKACDVGDEMWNTFFTDMYWGLSETDIEIDNYAYVRYDLMPDGWLKEEVRNTYESVRH